MWDVQCKHLLQEKENEKKTLKFTKKCFYQPRTNLKFLISLYMNPFWASKPYASAVQCPYGFDF